jgi:uncharacterized membrane protein
MGTAARPARLAMSTTAMTAGEVASAASTAASTTPAAMPHGAGRTGQRDRGAEHCHRQTEAPTLDSHDSLSFTAFGGSPLAALNLKYHP